MSGILAYVWKEKAKREYQESLKKGTKMVDERQNMKSTTVIWKGNSEVIRQEKLITLLEYLHHGPSNGDSGCGWDQNHPRMKKYVLEVFEH